ncbi:apolipoprotein N-acyltransferase [Leifsonia sp. EB41]|uniref:hypothetical protein n=1 Tax=Leifsonia sp. EB41 TaxID=3156260 RepID=UPI003515A032
MSVQLRDLEAVRRRQGRSAALVVAAVLTAIGTWLTLPFGVVLLTHGAVFGLALVVAGVVLLAACVVAIVGAARVRVTPQSLPGKPNPAFGEPRPSANPDGGYSTAGMKLGS